MQLKNKRVFFLGDSITQGSITTTPENSYVKVFERLSGCVAFNYGVSGTRIAKQKVTYLSTDFDYDFVSRVDDMLGVPDVVVVFGGTNDYGHGDAPLGNVDDSAQDSFCGAVNVLLGKIKCKYSLAKIIFVLPLRRTDEIVTRETINKDGRLTLDEYVKVIRMICEKHGVSVCDLRGIEELNPNDKVFGEQNFADGLHPNDNGHKVLAEKMYEYFCKM